MTVYTPDQWQEAIVGLANAGAGGTPADIVATGTLTAAQPTVGTPVVGGTVSITLGDGQATVEAALTGTWNAGTTVLFEGTEDSGVTTNWFPMFGQDTSVANPPNISSIAGGASKLIRIPSMGYAQVRVRANPFAGGDSVAVRLVASVAGSGMAGALSTNDGTFAKETGGVLGATTDAAVVGDSPGSISAKARGLTKILNAVWDSVNNLLNTNTSRVGGTAVSVNAGTVDAGTQRVSLATDQKVPTKAASGDFATGAIVDLPPKGAAATSASTPVNIASDQVVPVKRSAVAVYSLASAAQTANGNSGDLAVSAYTEIGIDINITADSGTNETIQFFWDRKGADSVYYSLWQSKTVLATDTLAEQIITSIGAGMVYALSLGLTGRLRWVVTGTNPSFTLSANVYGK